MPFLAPLIPAIVGGLSAAGTAIAPALPQLISTGASIAGGLLSKPLSKPSNDQSQSNNLLNSAAIRSMDDSAKSRDMGLTYLDRFSRNLSTPSNYFQSLLSGDSARTTSTLAPDINRINSQAQSLLQGTSLSPRGGGRSETLFNLPFQAGAQTAGLFNSTRPGAAKGLMDVAGMQGQVGSNLLQTSGSQLRSGVDASRGLLESALAQRKLESESGKGLGTLFGNLFSGLKLPSFGGKSGGGGGSLATLIDVPDYGQFGGA